MFTGLTRETTTFSLEKRIFRRTVALRKNQTEPTYEFPKCHVVHTGWYQIVRNQIIDDRARVHAGRDLLLHPRDRPEVRLPFLGVLQIRQAADVAQIADDRLVVVLLVDGLIDRPAGHPIVFQIALRWLVVREGAAVDRRELVIGREGGLWSERCLLVAGVLVGVPLTGRRVVGREVLEAGITGVLAL